VQARFAVPSSKELCRTPRCHGKPPSPCGLTSPGTRPRWPHWRSSPPHGGTPMRSPRLRTPRSLSSVPLLLTGDRTHPNQAGVPA
jgi:hypothetical protein